MVRWCSRPSPAGYLEVEPLRLFINHQEWQLQQMLMMVHSTCRNVPVRCIAPSTAIASTFKTAIMGSSSLNHELPASFRKFALERRLLGLRPPIYRSHAFSTIVDATESSVACDLALAPPAAEENLYSTGFCEISPSELEEREGNFVSF